MLLATISAGVHFAALSQPREVVFDEVHFGKFVTAYCCSHENIFDIHPPHGKIIIAAGSKILGYRGGFDFEYIGKPYPSHISPIALRIMPALAGFFIPLVAFVLLRQLNLSSLIAFLGGLALALDNALVVQSRIIALDSILILATLGALSFFFFGQSRRHAGWYVASGALAGLAVGVKFTGLAALGIIGLLIIGQLIKSRTYRDVKYMIKTGLFVLGAAVVVYGIGWATHYTLLTRSGPGDEWQRPSGSLVRDTIEMHRIMFDANYNLDATHPYSSKWWEWLVMHKPVFYWQSDTAGLMYFIGNPVVWWGATILLVSGIVHTCIVRRKITYSMGVFAVSYVVSFAPFVGVPRALFLYHYLTPMVFALLFGLAWIDSLLEASTFTKKRKMALVGGAVVLISAGFILYSPLTYGFSVPAWAESLFFVPGWR